MGSVRRFAGLVLGPGLTFVSTVMPAAVGAWVANVVWPQTQVTFFVRRTDVTLAVPNWTDLRKYANIAPWTGKSITTVTTSRR